MLTLAAALLLAASLTGCGGSTFEVTSPGGPGPRFDAGNPLADVATPRPGALRMPLRSADILVTSKWRLSSRVAAAIRHAEGVVSVERFSIANFYAEGQPVVYAAVDPRTFRRFTPRPTATYQEIWDRIADGEIALTPQLHRTLPLVDDYVTIGNDQGAQRAHVATYADLVTNSDIGALVNARWAARLGMTPGNAMLVSTGRDPSAALTAIRRHLPKGTVAQKLTGSLVGQEQSAVLTGGSIAAAVGSFTYTINSDGTVNPDSRWVREYIRTESVPILGQVTCNKAVLPQLRGALKSIVEQGLADEIDPHDYGGCYVPRFIANDPTRGLSFHTWGMAIDLNVSHNQRGTPGDMDPAIVQVFAQWGFNWGGTWQDPDPMHFELARIVTPR